MLRLVLALAILQLKLGIVLLEQLELINVRGGLAMTTTMLK